jgi:hypothetical protein
MWCKTLDVRDSFSSQTEQGCWRKPHEWGVDEAGDTDTMWEATLDASFSKLRGEESQ